LFTLLASASIVLNNRSLLVGSGLLGILGVLLMLNGFTLTLDIPFLGSADRGIWQVVEPTALCSIAFSAIRGTAAGHR
jgi:hypothetical protein